MNHLEFYEIKRNSLTSSSFPTQLPSDDLLNDAVCSSSFILQAHECVCVYVCVCVCVCIFTNFGITLYYAYLM